MVDESRKRVSLSLTVPEFQYLEMASKMMGVKITTAAHLALIKGLPEVMTDAQKHISMFEFAKANEASKQRPQKARTNVQRKQDVKRQKKKSP